MFVGEAMPRVEEALDYAANAQDIFLALGQKSNKPPRMEASLLQQDAVFHFCFFASATLPPLKPGQKESTKDRLKRESLLALQVCDSPSLNSTPHYAYHLCVPGKKRAPPCSFCSRRN